MSTRSRAGGQRRRLLAAASLAPWLCTPASGQPAWPTRPVRLLVPAPPGGELDLFARALAQQLTLALGQSVLVLNVPGAGGLIGAQAAARALADGYTLALIHSGQVTLQAINPKLTLLRDLLPLAKLAHSPLVVVVRADAPYRSLGELITAIGAQPGRLSYSSGGNGSPSHLAVAEMAYRLRGFSAVAVPYGGAAEAALALTRGDVDFQIGVLGAVLPLIVSGRLRALAVTGRHRIGALPEVPTVAEVALPGYDIDSWSGLAIPAGAPAEVVARIGDVLPQALGAEPIRSMSLRLGFEIARGDGSSFARQVAIELEVEKQRVQRLGLQAPP